MSDEIQNPADELFNVLKGGVGQEESALGINEPAPETPPTGGEGGEQIQPETQVKTPVEVKDDRLSRVADPEPAPQIEGLSDFLSKTTGGRITTQEQLVEYLKTAGNNEGVAAAEPIPHEYSHPLVGEIDAYLREKGGDVSSLNQFLHIQALDTENISAREAIAEEIRLENPDWTREDIDLYMEDKYQKVEIDPEEMDESEVRAAEKRNRLVEMSMNQDGRQAKMKLAGMKSDLSKYKSATAEQLKEQADARENQLREWKEGVSGAAQGLSAVQFELDGGKPFSWKVNDEERSEVRGDMENLATYFNRFSGENGVDYDGLAQFMYVARNFGKMIRGVASYAAKHGESAFVQNNLGNVPDIISDKPAGDGGTVSPQEVVNAILGN